MSEDNIKEDIKWIEKIIKKCDDCGLHECIVCEICWTEVQAIKHVLKDYKKLQEEFKQVDHECERLEEKEVRLIKENEQLRTELNSLKEELNLKEDCYLWLHIAVMRGLEIEKLRKENEVLYENYISKQEIKAIIDRIDYDIKKTKEIISNNSNIYTSDRKNDYQIVRLRAMNTKSLDIKKRLQELLESEE